MQGIGLAQGPPCACRPAPIPICVDSSPEAYLKSQAAVFQLGVEALLDRQARQKVHAGSWVALPVHLGQVLHHRDRHGVDPAGSKNVNDRMCAWQHPASAGSCVALLAICSRAVGRNAYVGHHTLPVQPPAGANSSATQKAQLL